MKYQVVVGNIGTVVDTDDRSEATRTFHEYVWKSTADEGRATGEPITLFRDGEPLVEFSGKVEE